MLAEPAAEPLEPALGIGDDRLVGQPVLEVAGQLAHRVVAVGGLQGHRLQADRLERGRHRAADRPRRPEIALDHPLDHLRDLVAAEGDLAGEQLVERRAQAVDVAGGTHLVEVAAGLLGAHVRRRADRRARLRLAGVRPRPPTPRGSARRRSPAMHRHDVGLADHLGQPPVDDQRLAVAAQHDVGRLQVAVEHAAAVGVVDRVADVEEPPEQLPELDAPHRLASRPPASLAAPALVKPPDRRPTGSRRG